jgi:hypothetical protein
MNSERSTESGMMIHIGSPSSPYTYQVAKTRSPCWLMPRPHPGSDALYQMSA